MSGVESQSPNAFFAESYCRLVGLFALKPTAQRALLPAVVEPVYVSFNEGDGYHSQPLDVVFHTLRDVAVYIVCHSEEEEFLFVPRIESEALLEALSLIYREQWKLDDCFDTSQLEATYWVRVRHAARLVWEKLATTRQLPFGDWRDFIG